MHSLQTLRAWPLGSNCSIWKHSRSLLAIKLICGTNEAISKVHIPCHNGLPHAKVLKDFVISVPKLKMMIVRDYRRMQMLVFILPSSKVCLAGTGFKSPPAL
jgi:hypothetical protein